MWFDSPHRGCYAGWVGGNALKHEFAVGSKAVYPVHGVAEVVALEQRDIGGNQTAVYILKIIDTGLKIMLPTMNAGSVGLRDLIKTGSVFEIAEVMRDLSVLRATKDLSFGERKMLETARGLLIKELAIAKGVGEDKIGAEVDAIFAAAAA